MTPAGASIKEPFSQNRGLGIAAAPPCLSHYVTDTPPRTTPANEPPCFSLAQYGALAPPVIAMLGVGP